MAGQCSPWLWPSFLGKVRVSPPTREAWEGTHHTSLQGGPGGYEHSSRHPGKAGGSLTLRMQN